MGKTVLWQATSRYALVTCYDMGEGKSPMVEKIISPDKVNSGNAQWVNDISMFFRKKLKLVGVPLAEPYTFLKENGSAVQWSPYVGLDLEQVFKNGNGTEELLVQLVVSMKGVLSQRKPTVGIDARLSNFCKEQNGSQVIYVDTFPPIVIHRGQRIVHFPNPVEEAILKQEFFRKFEALGILRRLRFSLLEQGSSFSEESLINAIREVMGNEFALRIQEYFNTFPDHLPLQEALDSLSLDEPDAIREIAVMIMPKESLERAIFLKEVFDLSSNYCPYNLSPARRLQRIQELFTLNH